MEKTCKQFQTDITDYARGAFQYVKDYDALYNHLRACESCRNKLFGLEELCYNLRAAEGPSPKFQKRMAELREKFKKGPPPLTEADKKETPLKRGIALFQQQKWSEAKNQFEEAVVQSPNDANTYYHRALAEQKMNKLDDALKDFNRSLELDPDDADAAYHRGEVYSQQQKWTEALRDFFCAIQLNPDHTEAYKERAWIYYQTQRMEEALADCQEVIEREPANAKAYAFRGAVYLGLDQPERAMLDFNKTLELNPSLTQAYYNRGQTYLTKLNQPEKAVLDFTKVLERAPQTKGAYFRRGLAYYLMDQPEKALTDLTQTLGLGPATAAEYLYRGLVYGKLNQADQAIKDFTKAIELAPKHVRPTLEKQPRPEDSVSEGEALAYHNRGVAYRMQGDLARAQADFKTALKLNPQLAQAQTAIQSVEQEIKRQALEADLKKTVARVAKVGKVKAGAKRDLSADKAGTQAELKALREQVKSLQAERDLFKKQLEETLGMMAFLPKEQPAYQFIAPPLPS